MLILVRSGIVFERGQEKLKLKKGKEKKTRIGNRKERRGMTL